MEEFCSLINNMLYRAATETMNEIFHNFGIQIFKRDNRYFIRYDNGALVIEMREDEITEEQAQRAQMSEQDAHKVLLEVECFVVKPT